MGVFSALGILLFYYMDWRLNFRDRAAQGTYFIGIIYISKYRRILSPKPAVGFNTNSYHCNNNHMSIFYQH